MSEVRHKERASYDGPEWDDLWWRRWTSTKAYETQVLVDSTCFTRWKIQGQHERETKSNISDNILEHELESNDHKLVIVVMINRANKSAVISFTPVEIWVAS